MSEILSVGGGMRAELRRLYWVGDRLTVDGWLRLDHPAVTAGFPTISLISMDAAGQIAGSVPATQWTLSSANGSDEEADAGCFTAEIDEAICLDTGRAPGKFSILVQVESGDDKAAVPFDGLRENCPPAGMIAGWSGRLLLCPAWDDESGLTLASSRPQVTLASEVASGSDVVEVEISVRRGFAPVSAAWGPGKNRPGKKIWLETSGRIPVLKFQDMPGIEPTKGRWSIMLRDAAGRTRRLHCDPSQGFDLHLPIDGPYSLDRGADGLIRLVCRNPLVVAESVELAPEGDALMLTADLWNGSGAAVEAIVLAGKRAALTAVVDDDGRYRLPLRAKLWRDFEGAAPSGAYKILARLSTQDKMEPVRLGNSLIGGAMRDLQSQDCAIRMRGDEKGWAQVEIAAPLRPAERGDANRKRLAQYYSEGTPDQLEGVFLESWYGKSFSDNPAALVGALSEAGVPGPYYATVADLSVETPSTVVPVVAGSEAYWAALGRSRHIIFNTWLPGEFVKRPGQIVVQTWHGTPLKLLGVHAPKRAGNEKSALRLESGAKYWDMLVTQNPHASDVLARAYRYHGRIVESGYPRNDILSAVNRGEIRAKVRAWLGVPALARVVLYAPTWREEAKGSIGPLDIGSLKAKLPDDVIILARGHSVALRRGKDIVHQGVIDVTSYPEPAELMLASDCLLTDYSSIMFDYPVLNCPMIFYVPDLEEYTINGQGTYFDLRDAAPGPLVADEDALVSALHCALDPSWAPDEAFNRWRNRYCVHDDGQAAMRVVEALLEVTAAGSNSKSPELEPSCES